MNILVLVCVVPDTTSKIDFSDEKTLKTENINWILNPYDDWCALVRALEIKQTRLTQNLPAKVSILTVDGAHADPLLKKALAIGKDETMWADEAIRIDFSGEKDAFQIAKEIENFIKNKGNFDLIMTGKSSISSNNGQVPGILAGLLDLPLIPEAVSLEIENDQIHCNIEQEGNLLKAVANFPVIISAASGMAEQLIPNMKGILAAKKKEIIVIDPQKTNPKVKIIKQTPPAPKSACVFFSKDQIEELIENLEKEKVL